MEIAHVLPDPKNWEGHAIASVGLSPKTHNQPHHEKTSDRLRVKNILTQLANSLQKCEGYEGKNN